MILTTLLFAVSAGSLAGPRISFESPGETLPVIAQRLSDEMGQEITVAQKLQRERLYIVARNQEPHAILEQIAEALHAEVLPRGQALFLDRTPAGERRMESLTDDLHSVFMGANFEALIEEYSAPLTRVEADEFAAAFREWAAQTNGVQPRDTYLQMRALQAQSPDHRLAARLLQLVPRELLRPSLTDDFMESAPTAVLSSRPTRAEVDISGTWRNVWGSYIAETQAWRQMVAHHGLESISPDEETPLGWMSQGLLRTTQPKPLDLIGDMIVRVMTSEFGAVLDILLFDQQGAFLQDHSLSLDREPNEAVFEALDQLMEDPERFWIPPGQVIIEGPSLGDGELQMSRWLAVPGGIEALEDLTFRVIRHLSEAIDRSVVIPVYSPEMFLSMPGDEFDLSEVTMMFQMLEMFGDFIADEPVRRDEDWLTFRMFGGMFGEMMYGWGQIDAAALHRVFARVKERGTVDVLDYVRLAGAMESAMLYNELSNRLARVLTGEETLAATAPPLNFTQARLVNDLIQNDDRRLQTGATRRFHQLSEPAQQAVNAWIYGRDFLGAPNWEQLQGASVEVLQEAEQRHIASQRLERVPTQRWPAGIPSQATISLESSERYSIVGTSSYNGFDFSHRASAYEFAMALLQEERGDSSETSRTFSLSLDQVITVRLVADGVEESYEFVTTRARQNENLTLADLPEPLKSRVEEYLEQLRARPAQGTGPPPIRRSGGSGQP